MESGRFIVIIIFRVRDSGRLSEGIGKKRNFVGGVVCDTGCSLPDIAVCGPVYPGTFAGGHVFGDVCKYRQ